MSSEWFLTLKYLDLFRNCSCPYEVILQLTDKSTSFWYFILGNKIYFASKEIKDIMKLDLSPLYNELHLVHW